MLAQKVEDFENIIQCPSSNGSVSTTNNQRQELGLHAPSANKKRPMCNADDLDSSRKQLKTDGKAAVDGAPAPPETPPQHPTTFAGFLELLSKRSFNCSLSGTMFGIQQFIDNNVFSISIMAILFVVFPANTVAILFMLLFLMIQLFRLVAALKLVILQTVARQLKETPGTSASITDGSKVDTCQKPSACQPINPDKLNALRAKMASCKQLKNKN